MSTRLMRPRREECMGRSVSVRRCREPPLRTDPEVGSTPPSGHTYDTTFFQQRDSRHRLARTSCSHHVPTKGKTNGNHRT